MICIRGSGLDRRPIACVKHHLHINVTRIILTNVALSQQYAIDYLMTEQNVTYDEQPVPPYLVMVSARITLVIPGRLQERLTFLIET